MSSPMDKVPFVNPPQNELINLLQQARQNPKAFENQLRSTNPKAYEMACKIRNSPNRQQAILQLARERGVDPNIFRMFGLM